MRITFKIFYIFNFLFIFFLVTYSFADQNDNNNEKLNQNSVQLDSEKDKLEEPRWIKPYKIGMYKIGTFMPSSSITYEPSDHSLSSIQYQPNPQGFIELSGAYRDQYVGISFSTGNKNPSLYGRTHVNDFVYRLNRNEHTFEFRYQYYQGFYLDQFDLFEGYVIRSDISALHMGLNYFYVFSNHRYSLESLINMTRMQVRSGGSWLGYASYDFNEFNSSPKFDSREEVKVDLNANKYGEIDYLKENHLHTFSFGGGYGYNWVFWKNWRLGGALVYALGLQNLTKSLITHVQPVKVKSESGWKIGNKLSSKFNFGWQTKEKFYMLYAESDMVTNPNQKGNLNFSSYTSGAVFGMYF